MTYFEEARVHRELAEALEKRGMLQDQALQHTQAVEVQDERIAKARKRLKEVTPYPVYAPVIQPPMSPQVTVCVGCLNPMDTCVCRDAPELDPKDYIKELAPPTIDDALNHLHSLADDDNPF